MALSFPLTHHEKTVNKGVFSSQGAMDFLVQRSSHIDPGHSRGQFGIVTDRRASAAAKADGREE